MALDFDGTGDAIDFGTGINWSGGAFGSLSGWFNLDVINDARGMNKSDGLDDAGQTMKLGYSTAGTFNVTCIISETSVSSIESIGTGEWFHLVVTYDGSNVRMYLNGVEVDSTAKTGNVNSDSRNMRIGSAGHDAGLRNVNGRGRLFEIWDRVLTPNEVLTMCLRGHHGIVRKRFYAWRCNEKASGSPAATGVKNTGEKDGGDSIAIDGTPFYVGEEFAQRWRYR